MPVYAEGVSVEMISRREYEKRAKEEAAKILDRVVGEGGRGRRRVRRVHAIDGAPWEAILAARQEGEVRRDRHGLARPARARRACCSAARRPRC